VPELRPIPGWEERLRRHEGCFPQVSGDFSGFTGLVTQEKLVRPLRTIGLALDFLLDPAGANRCGADVKALLQELAITHDFTTAFANNMGMSVKVLHDNLRDLLAAWLERRT